MGSLTRVENRKREYQGVWGFRERGIETYRTPGQVYSEGVFLERTGRTPVMRGV